MIYKQIPNSYTSLNEAIEGIQIKLEVTPKENIPFTIESLERFLNYRPIFLKEFIELRSSKKAQLLASDATNASRNRLDMHVRHFFNNLNNAIAREVFVSSDRAYYDLDHDEDTIPYIRSQKDLLGWGKKIIDGEIMRVKEGGGKPLDFPSSNEVQDKYNEYRTALQKHKNSREAQDLELEDVEAIYEEGVAIIKDIWDEIEFKYRHESASSRRNKAAIWGVRYISSKERTTETKEIAENMK